MSNWKDEQSNDEFQTILNAGDNALQDLYKLQEEINDAGKAQANEAEQLNTQADGALRRLLSWLAVAIVMVSLLASPTKAQDLPQVPPTPTVGKPARIELVYLPLVAMTAGDSAEADTITSPSGGNAHAPNVNWNSKKVYGGWQARGN